MRAGFPLILLTALFLSCGNAPEKHSASNSRYGGVFNLNETEALRSIFPLTLTQASSFRIMSQVYQGLVAFDSNEPAAVWAWARRWLRRIPPQKDLDHLSKILKSWEPQEFEALGGIQPDGTWVEVEPPTRRRRPRA